MTLGKKFKILVIIVVTGLIIGGGIVLYMFNMPHRNVQNTATDFHLSTTQLVSEYLSDVSKANNKYLSDDGESKVLEITGTVVSIYENYDGQKVVILQESTDKAGTTCVFLKEKSVKAGELEIGETIAIKGVIRSGAAYDEDLELFENNILDKCDLVE